ncbi:MAG: hypothetical protein IH600_03120 [Bacteroidetes bacterium]|nr:hypothetical protein [Bacteroidota bacterium]
MNHWQDIVVVCLIAAASLYVAYVLWCRLARRGNACCNTCPGCGSHSDGNGERETSRPLTIQTPTRRVGED